MEIETATNPVGDEDTAVATLETEAEVETEETEAEFDDDGNPIEEPPEDEEIDLDDLKLKVPKDQAQKVREAMLRQADYTRKTQELAEQRKTVEAERQSISEATQDELAVFADASVMAQQLAQYQRIDWAAWSSTAPMEAQRAFMQYQQTKDAHANAMGQLSHMRQERVSKAQQETATRIEEGRAKLASEIGWNDELKAKLTNHALERGLSRDDLGDLEANPAAVLILKDAYEWREHQKKSQAAKRHETAQQAQPAATVSARRAPPAGLDDRLSIDEWTKRREAQLRKKQG